MTTVKAPTLAAVVNRLIRARAKLPGGAPAVEFQRRSWPARGGAPARARPWTAAWRALRPCLAGAGLLLTIAGCAEEHAPSARPGPRSPAGQREPTAPGDLVWQDATGSPQPSGDDPDLPACGDADAALARVARRVAEREAAGRPQLDSLELAFALRVEGSPYVWPHTWTLLSPGFSRDDAAARVARFLASFPDSGARRCGAALERGERGAALAVVVVDALADLSPLRTRVHAGQWLSFDAELRVPAPHAKLVVLGPSGPPRAVPTTLHGGRARATWVADRPGPWTAQLVATVSGGPRPVLEAMVFAEVEPPGSFMDWPAPGELEAAPDATDATDAVRRMVNGARVAEGLTALSPDPRLDALAAEHAARMRARRTLAHDVGDGDPLTRLARASLEPRSAGENVAHALTVRRAHRALWSSPSHRGNLLDPRFRALGVGVARDDDGSLWVCELFAFFAQTGNAG